MILSYLCVKPKSWHLGTLIVSVTFKLHQNIFYSCNLYSSIVNSAIFHFHPSPIFANKAVAYPNGPITRYHHKGRLFNVPANIRLGSKCQGVANTLAYNVY